MREPADHEKPESYCCDMRRSFLIGILAHRTDLPLPVEMADFVIEWEPRITIRIRHCPFCGKLLDNDQTVRVKQ